MFVYLFISTKQICLLFVAHAVHTQPSACCFLQLTGTSLINLRGSLMDNGRFPFSEDKPHSRPIYLMSWGQLTDSLPGTSRTQRGRKSSHHPDSLPALCIIAPSPYINAQGAWSTTTNFKWVWAGGQRNNGIARENTLHRRGNSSFLWQIMSGGNFNSQLRVSLGSVISWMSHSLMHLKSMKDSHDVILSLKFLTQCTAATKAIQPMLSFCFAYFSKMVVLYRIRLK